MNLGKHHISILSTRNVIWTFFWRPPPLPLETSRTFFDSAEAPKALFIVKALRLSAVYKSIKVHLEQGQDLIMSTQIYFKYKYTYKNAGFCILCIDEFKYQNFRTDYRNFLIFIEKVTGANSPHPTPQRPCDVSSRQNRYATLPLVYIVNFNYLAHKNIFLHTLFSLLRRIS